jgi:hypothetical protein
MRGIATSIQTQLEARYVAPDVAWRTFAAWLYSKRLIFGELLIQVPGDRSRAYIFTQPNILALITIVDDRLLTLLDRTLP